MIFTVEEAIWYFPTIKRFQAAIDNALNTSGALAVLFKLIKELQQEGNRLVHEGQTQASPELLWQQWQTLLHLARILGLDAEYAPFQ